MTENHAFQADAAIIDRLGRELVSKQETALIELVKNAYDADATRVDVVLLGQGKNRTIEVRDNGSGMAKQTILDVFLTLAHDAKVRDPTSQRYKRRRAGQKGIGRLAAQRLGEKLVLSTWSRSNQPGYRLCVDWTQFQPGVPLEDVTVQLDRIKPRSKGTVVRIEQLRDTWTDSQIRQCWRSVLALQPPFPIALAKGDQQRDPGFKVRFLQKQNVFHDEEVVADLTTEILDHMHATIKMKVDGKGRASWRISKNKFGSQRSWRMIHHLDRESKKPSLYEDLQNVDMIAYYAILDSESLPRLVLPRIRDLMSGQGGIRLYRNGFRVVPYGEPGNDWLRLDEAYTRRNVLVPIANRNFLGYVSVSDESGENFQEHTSREGLIETSSFNQLKGLASSVLINAARAIGEDRGRKTRTTSRPKPSSADSPFREAKKALRETTRAVADAARSSGDATVRDAAGVVADVTRLVTRSEKEYQRKTRQLADETAMLRFLATLGMTTAEFSHETGMTFDAFRLDFESVFKVAVQARKTNKRFLARVERARDMLDRLDTLTAYLNTLAGARSAREMGPVSLRKAVRTFGKGITPHSMSEGIEMRTKLPPYDALFTRPMHEAEVASVLLNFYTNAIKAMKRAGGRRRLLIEAFRSVEPASRVGIAFSDSGDGVAENVQDKIFDAFFTTQTAPSADVADLEHAKGTGLGLWIVQQIAENSGGDVHLVEPPKGYVTCFEILFPAEKGDGQ